MRTLHVASGTALSLTMAAAFAVVAGRIASVASGPAAPPVGAPAPDFRAPGLDPGTRSLAEHRGQVVVLDFWATWCPPCVASMPHLQELFEAHRAEGLVVLGVNQEPGSEPRVQAFLDQRGLTFPQVVDDGRKVARAYAVYTYPTTVVIDRSGRIRQRFRGPVTARRLKEVVRPLLAVEPTEGS